MPQRAFVGFQEGTITFPPTYRMNKVFQRGSWVHIFLYVLFLGHMRSLLVSVLPSTRDIQGAPGYNNKRFQNPR